MKTAERYLALLLLMALTGCQTPSGGSGGGGGGKTLPVPDSAPDTAPDTAPEPAPDAGEPAEPTSPFTKPVRVKVLQVLEAGMLDVKKDGNRRRVRLIGITAPRPPGRKEPAQYYGAEARAWVEEQILSRNVHLQFLRERRKDKRDRLLAYVLVEGKDFNARLVRRGLAWADAGGDHPRQDEYRRWEKEARKGRRGMWGRPSTAED